MASSTKHWMRIVIQCLLIPPLLLLFVPIVLLWLLGSLLIRAILLLIVWCIWSPQGINMLTVYSNSPYWQNYFEEGILPIVNKRSVVLNWSERSRWPISLGKIVFATFRGEKEFNPLIFFFPPFRRPRALRFYPAFHDAKHGKIKKLAGLEAELSRWIDQPVDLAHLHPRCSA